MRPTKLLTAFGLTVGIACTSARPAAASVLYTINGGTGPYSGIALTFETATFISIPYTVTNPIECSGCSDNAVIEASPYIRGLALIFYKMPTVTYILDFMSVDFGNFGTYQDYYAAEGDTMTVSEVPEPASLALLMGGVFALAFARRRGPGQPNTL